MAETGQIELRSMRAGSNYAATFGALADKTVYVDKANGIDLRPDLKAKYDAGRQLVEAKAMQTTTGGAGTAGYALIPVAVDPRIIPYFSRLYIPNLGFRFAHDTGTDVIRKKASHGKYPIVDIFFMTEKEAMRFVNNNPKIVKIAVY